MFIAIIPAYNEEGHIGSVVRDLFEHVDKVVVVDDGSEDNTVNIAKDLGAEVLQHKINRGQGAAIETGHEYARKVGAEYVVHFDGDGQFDVLDIAPALEKIKEHNADVLFGSRYLDNRSQVPWLKKNILLPLGRIINRIFTGLKLSDAHNGFRILNKKALDNIIITQNGMAHASEIMGLVKENNLTYVEFPIKVTYHEFGQGISGGIKTVRDLLVGRFVK
ncbi:glycosyltransferase family 2 protein [Patescibacteria group bacterium]|nr:glycosyltransferase family 2 protein [Patescibacteria group bacterium]